MVRESTKRTNKTLVGLLVLLVLLIGSYFAIPEGSKPHVHAKLKDLKIHGLELDVLFAKNGETLDTVKKKSHILMVFFTLNCSDTKTNIKILNELHQREDLTVVGYMMSGTSRAEKFAKNYGVEFPLAKPSLDYMQIFEPNVHPSSYLVRTNDLKVKEKYVGIIFPQNVINGMENF